MRSGSSASRGTCSALYGRVLFIRLMRPPCGRTRAHASRRWAALSFLRTFFFQKCVDGTLEPPGTTANLSWLWKIAGCSRSPDLPGADGEVIRENVGAH